MTDATKPPASCGDLPFEHADLVSAFQIIGETPAE
jgi:hypothetical protein